MLEDLTSSNKVVIAGFFKDLSSDNAKLFESLATDDDKHTYAYVNDLTLWEKYDVKDSSILLLKSFEEKEMKFTGDFESDKIKEFIKENSRPYIFELNEENNNDIFDTGIKQFVMMILDSEKNAELLEMVSYESQSYNFCTLILCPFSLSFFLKKIKRRKKKVMEFTKDDRL